MTTDSTLKRQNINSRSGLLYGGKAVDICGTSDVEVIRRRTSLCKDVDGLSLTKSLVRVVSDKFKKKRNDLLVYSDQERLDSDHVSSGCLSLYVTGGGCRVGACDELDLRLSAIEECLPRRMSDVVGEDAVECFSYGASERFWKKNVKKGKSIEQQPSSSKVQGSLPDDIWEMILARLPLASLVTARCVCRKWRYLTTTPHFIQIRGKNTGTTPWLFLFGITRAGSHPREVHALDVSRDRWHRISNHNLNRFLFSVASIGSDIYIVGGRSSSAFSMEKGSVKTHKGVLIFHPLTGSWHKTARMRSARSRPALGVFKVNANCSIFHTRTNRPDKPTHKSRGAGSSGVFEDPHRLSVRRRLRDAFFEDDDSPEPIDKPNDFSKVEIGTSSRFALIVVGGFGCWDEPLDSGEVYDPTTCRWMDIPNLPADFGAVCSGAVCDQMFYVFSESDKLAGYDLERGFWVTIQTSRPPPRLHEYSPKLVSCRDRLFLFSVSWCERAGQSNRRDKAVRKLWELDSDSTAWHEVSRHPDAPMDWNAAFVASDSSIYGVEMFGIFGQVLDFVTACHISDADFRWSHVSKKHAAHEADATSCTTKSIVVLHL